MVCNLLRTLSVCGIYLASLFDRLGIAAEMKPKTKHAPGPACTRALPAGKSRSDFNRSAKSWLNRVSNSSVRCRRDSEHHTVCCWHHCKQHTGGCGQGVGWILVFPGFCSGHESKRGRIAHFAMR